MFLPSTAVLEKTSTQPQRSNVLPPDIPEARDLSFGACVVP